MHLSLHLNGVLIIASRELLARKEFSALDKQHKPVNLSSGFPDFTPTKSIVQELEKCHLSETASLHQYTSPFVRALDLAFMPFAQDEPSPEYFIRTQGHPRLVKVLAALYGKLLNRSINPLTEVLVTLGATNALFCAIMSNVGHGDEVCNLSVSTGKNLQM